jgi:anthranilate synthase component 1
MALTPDFETFARAYDAGENQIVYTRLAADLDTPVSLMLKLTGAQKDAFVLESVTGGEVRGRYSIIGMKPDLVWRCEGDTSAINRTARFDADAFENKNNMCNERIVAKLSVQPPTAFLVQTYLEKIADQF